MPLDDKIAAAKKISELLNAVFAAGDFRLRYKITVDPVVGADREWERPEILVELSGSDTGLVLENGGELLRAFEQVSLEMLRLTPDEHEKVSFDDNVRHAGVIGDLEAGLAPNPVLQKRTLHTMMAGKWRRDDDMIRGLEQFSR